MTASLCERPGETWRPRNRSRDWSRNRNILLSQCHDADTPHSSGRAASAPIISILCYSAQDGGAGSGKGRNSEYFFPWGGKLHAGNRADVLLFMFRARRARGFHFSAPLCRLSGAYCKCGAPCAAHSERKATPLSSAAGEGIGNPIRLCWDVSAVCVHLGRSAGVLDVRIFLAVRYAANLKLTRPNV